MDEMQKIVLTYVKAEYLEEDDEINDELKDIEKEQDNIKQKKQ